MLPSNSPNIGIILLSDRNILVTAKDIFSVSTGNLALTGQINVNNTTAGAITAGAYAGIIYTRLDGLMGRAACQAADPRRCRQL